MKVREALEVQDGLNSVEILKIKAYVFEEEPDGRGEYYVQALTPAGPMEFHSVEQANEFLEERLNEIKHLTKNKGRA